MAVENISKGREAINKAIALLTGKHSVRYGGLAG